MIPLVSSTSNESSGSWLPITEYSVKSGVSLSTIRRKIKANSIPFRFESGKYFIWYVETFPTVNTQATIKATPAPIPAISFKTDSAAVHPTPRRETVDSWQQPAVEKSVQMVAEAYEHALSDKEAQLVRLEKRTKELENALAEMRSLVQTLEEKYEVRY